MSIYIEHFGLTQEPFSLAPDPRFLYESEQHREALAHLLYGVRDGGGFVLLTGEIGTGKTTVFRCFLEDVPGEVRLALLLHPRLSARELLAAVCTEFGIPLPEEQTGTRALVERINTFLFKVGADGGRAVIVIDEAQNLSPDVLEELRLLTNLETNRRKLLQIVLIGQPELRIMIARPALAQVSQRVVARYHLGPLGKDELRAYVEHRLAKAGGAGKIFSPSVYPLLFRLSRGIPRLINLICDRALLGAYAKGERSVSPRLIKGAAAEVIGGAVTRRRVSVQVAAAAILAAAALAYTGSWYAGQGEKGTEMEPGERIAAATAAPESPRNGRDYGLAWLFEEAGKGTRRDAEALLLGLWHTGTGGTEMSFCEAAAREGLSCLEGTGGLRELQRLDRPALLRMPTGGGEDVYAVLALTDGQSSKLLFKGGEGEVHLNWFGSYTILWKPPPDYDGEILPGRKSAVVPWIREALSKAGFADAGGESEFYDDKLSGQVKAFQSSRGIEADGRVVPLTMIHLNTLLGIDGPRLKRGES